jgi:protein CpxP
MKSTKWITMAAALTLSATMAVAAPHGGGKHHKRGGEMMGPRVAAKLNLTDAQKQQIRDLHKSFREQNKATFENAREARKAFREAKKANDTARMEQVKPAMEAQRAEFKQLRDARRQQLLSILTPEQRTQFEAMKAEREQRRGQRGHGRNRR